MNSADRNGNVTLEELERSKWSELAHPSHLATECERLRRVQLRLLTAENLRILIGQNIGLQHLMPRAIEALRHNPLAQGDFHPGDLLCAVLRVEPEFWEHHGTVRAEVDAIANRARELAASEGRIVVRALEEAAAVFSSASADMSKGRRADRQRS